MPAKPGQYADGDTLFRNAVLTVCKSDKPRDGGTAIGVFADWIEEQLAETPWLCLHDHSGTGFTLLVSKTGVDVILVGAVDFQGDSSRTGEVLVSGLRPKLIELLRWFWE